MSEEQVFQLKKKKKVKPLKVQFTHLSLGQCRPDLSQLKKHKKIMQTDTKIF